MKQELLEKFVGEIKKDKVRLKEVEVKKPKYRENFFIRERLKDKKVVIVIKHSYTFNWQQNNILDRKPIECLFGYYEGDYEGYLGGCGDESFEGETLNERKKNMIKWLKDNLIEDGYNEKNISIKEIPLNKKKELKKWKEQYEKDLSEARKMAEREIVEYSKKLKKALRIKYGYGVELKAIIKNGEDYI